MNARPLRRAAYAALTLALAASAVSFTSTSANAAAAPNQNYRGHVAADWQATQLTDGRIYNDEFAFDDWGLTIDTAFALAADRQHAAELAEIATALEANFFDGYAASFGGWYAGSWAKTLLAAKVLGQDWRDYDGYNLRTETKALVAPASAGFEAGRLRDLGDADYSNTFTQAYGVLGLARTGGTPVSTVTYLLKQQCGDGYFRAFETVGQSCDVTGSAPDVDSTGLAIQALLAAKASGTAVPKAALNKAVSWLVGFQNADGSYGGGETTEVANANSSGLAASALKAIGRPAPAKRAGAWITTVQLTPALVKGTPAAADVWAVAYSVDDLNAALSAGIGVSDRDRFRRATPQAILGLLGASLNNLSAR